MTVAETLRAAIYCRISKDRAGAGLGVERQETDCRDLAERLGWEVVAVHVDNDISAYSGKIRPQYRAMLDAVRSGQVQAVLSWHPDRLYRRAVDLEEFVNLAEQYHLQVATVTSGDVDLATSTGRMTARIIGAVAQAEVERTRERVRSAKAQTAADGGYRGGPRPYGFNKDGVRIIEKEAQVLRDATRAVLSGRSLAAVVNELNAQGSRTSTGREWTRHSLRDVLLRHRNAGRVATGRRNGSEEVGPAVWPAIVEREQFEAVRRLLLAPGRRATDTTSEPKWLGSGIYICGRCQGIMRSFSVPRWVKGKKVKHPAYRCQDLDHVTIMGVKTDDYVRKVVADLVRDPRIVEAMTAGEDDGMQADRARRSLLVTRLEQTEADYDAGHIDGRRYKSATDKISAELAEIEERLAEGVQQAQVLPIFSDVDPGQAFLDAPLDIQRAVLRSVLRVEVQRYQGPRGGVWNSDRLRLSAVGA